MRKWFLIFIVAFGLNAIWENLHSFLYIHYQGGEITELILLRAALVDALIILVLAKLFFRYPWLIIPAGITVSIIIEYWALGIGRWEYKEIMPIIPWFNLGLTPTIQLGLLGYLSYKTALRRK